MIFNVFLKNFEIQIFFLNFIKNTNKHMAIKRPDIFSMVDRLYDYHFEKASSLYSKGMSIMIEGTIKKLACVAAIEHCDKQISDIKPNTKKTIYDAERYSDELVYWITVKEILKNK